jgi:hypothetical protein
VTGVHGLYLDNGTTNNTVKNNTCYKGDSNSVIFDHSSEESNVFENNEEILL